VKGRRKDDKAADKRGLSARGSERARERAAGGWGRFARERESGCGAGWRARAEAGRRWAEGGGAQARGKGGRGFGPGFGPTGGGEVFSHFVFTF
jgi:hypothetical protein